MLEYTCKKEVKGEDELPKIKVLEDTLFYEEKGVGDQKVTLLLLHGAGGCCYQWNNVFSELGGEYRIVSLDLPGHGLSTGRGRRSIESYVQVVRAFVRAAGLLPFVFCGHSMGGAIAMEYALRYSEDLVGMILMATGARLKVSPLFFEVCQDDDLDKLSILLGKFAFSPNVSLVQIKKWQKECGLPLAETFYGDFLACDNFDRLKEILDIQIPTLVVGGDEDNMTPLKYAHYLHEYISGAELEIVAGGGHMLMLEKPQEIRVIISKFIARIIQEF